MARELSSKGIRAIEAMEKWNKDDAAIYGGRRRSYELAVRTTAAGTVPHEYGFMEMEDEKLKSTDWRRGLKMDPSLEGKERARDGVLSWLGENGGRHTIS